MNYHTAVELQSGGYHYASHNRRSGTYPLGYCRDHGGHPTATEARECYAQYERDNIQLTGHCSWSDCTAEDCPNPANTYAWIQGNGYRLAVLCLEHLTVEHATRVLHLDQPAGDSYQS